MGQVIAVLCSDLHLSHNAPASRAAEPDWYAVMKRTVDEIREVAKQCDGEIIFAGDLFDTWKSPPELINFAIENLPTMLSIPGQHDLPFHVYADIRKSAYWTLVEARTIENLKSDSVTYAGELEIYSFPWGEGITVPNERRGNEIKLAVVHAYIAQAGSDYPGAPKESYVPGWKERLRGYDAAVFGDNHKGFLAQCGGCRVLNNGGLIRRKSDEMDYRPSVGLLYDDGTMEHHFLDISQDKWTDEAYRDHEVAVEDLQGMREFVKELGALSSDSLDYREAVRRYLTDQTPGEVVQKLLLQSIGQ